MMSNGYRFEDHDDEGIFAGPMTDEEGLGSDPKEVTGAAGDPDAAQDILMQGWVPGIQMSVTPDGLVEVMKPDGEVSILEPPPPVDANNLICLANCRHYTGYAVLVASGPDHDSDEHIEMRRRCGALRTWAQQGDLNEFECYACTHFEPELKGKSDVYVSAISRNAEELEKVFRQCIEGKVPLGICVAGPCENFVGQVGRAPASVDKKFYRHCKHLGGLGRFHDLVDEVVLSCTAWKPITNSPYIGSAAVENIQRMAKYNKEMAERSQED